MVGWFGGEKQKITSWRREKKKTTVKLGLPTASKNGSQNKIETRKIRTGAVGNFLYEILNRSIIGNLPRGTLLKICKGFALR